MDFVHWWKRADIVARSTVLGTVFAGLSLVWGIVVVFMPGGSIDCTIEANQGIAACDDIEIGGDVHVGPRP